MNNLFVKATLVVLFFISIFVNVALGVNLSSAKKNQVKLVEQQKEDKKQLSALNKKIGKYENSITEEEVSKDADNKELLNDFFMTQYAYTEKEYKDRFNKMKKYVNDDVYGQLTAAGVPDTPKISFENKVTDIQIFMTPSTSENNVSAMVLLKTQYRIESVTNPEVTQVFKLTIQNKKISSLETVGSFGQSLSES
ncbi:hypothetical protein P8815_18280 [Bacillus altitudinis]|uniref:hypothetical protein n=1 Tax=Bacillus TaxID=1386 RepID=UPI000260A6E8|nr:MULTISPECIES: hypothetical protein [Bacillus]EIL83342.1 hypothetical protein BAME_34060 [Bacillus sp. M 2-6]MEC0473689.1 hypothetical protein [Bacillus altitudinis]